MSGPALPLMLPPQDPNDPYGVRGGGIPALAEQAPNAPPQALPPEFARRPSLLSRVAGAVQPFKSDPTYAGFFDPEQENYAKSQAQQGLAAALMRAGGPAPRGTQNVFSRVGGALSEATANWPQMQAGMAQRAYQLWQAQLYMAQFQRAQSVFNSESQDRPGEPTGSSLLSRYLKLASIGGPGLEMAKAIEPVVKAVSGLDPSMWDVKEVYNPKTKQREFAGVHKVTGQTFQGLGNVPNAEQPARAQPGDVAQQAFTNVKNVYDKYSEAASDYRDRLQQARGALSIAPQLKSSTGPAQAVFLRQFVNAIRMKGARPGQADFELVNEASSLADKIQRKLNGYSGKGQLLSKGEVDELVGLAHRLYGGIAHTWQGLADEHRMLIRRAPDYRPGDEEVIRGPETEPEPPTTGLGDGNRAANSKFAGAPGVP